MVEVVYCVVCCCGGGGASVVTGQTVVVTGMVSVMQVVDSAGQLVTSGPHEVMVRVVVV